MALLAAAGVQAQKSPSTATATRVALTVDGIMRGPDLVGWPPTAVRWSADSAQLYFDWRRPAESGPRWARKDTHVTYVRDGNLFVARVTPAVVRRSPS